MGNIPVLIVLDPPLLDISHTETVPSKDPHKRYSLPWYLTPIKQDTVLL